MKAEAIVLHRFPFASEAGTTRCKGRPSPLGALAAKVLKLAPFEFDDWFAAGCASFKMADRGGEGKIEGR